MPSAKWYARTREERTILLEALRLYFIRHTTHLDFKTALNLDHEGLIRVVFVDSQDGRRAWVPELTPAGQMLGVEFFVPGEEPPDTAADEHEIQDE